MAKNKKATGGKKTNIYATVNGQTVQLTDRQVKAYIKRVRGWNDIEYRSEYEKLRKSLRTFEALQRSQGITVETQIPINVFYFETRARARGGADYVPSQAFRRLQGTQQYSLGKQLEKQVKMATPKYLKRTTEYTDTRFGGLIEANPTAKRIYETISDPVKREQALSDFVKRLRLKMTESGKIAENAAIPPSEVVGSGTKIWFNAKKYLK